MRKRGCHIGRREAAAAAAAASAAAAAAAAAAATTFAIAILPPRTISHGKKVAFT
jgi:hypothetical protein